MEMEINSFAAKWKTKRYLLRNVVNETSFIIDIAREPRSTHNVTKLYFKRYAYLYVKIYPRFPLLLRRTVFAK